MSLSKLKPYQEPPAPERAACAACKTFSPECLVPVGDQAVPMCWLCAHHVIDHDTSLETAHRGECECTPQEIYPHRTFATPGDLIAVEAPPEPTKTLREIEREKLLAGDPQKLTAWAVEAHKQMSISQHAAVQRKLKRRAS